MQPVGLIKSKRLNKTWDGAPYQLWNFKQQALGFPQKISK